MQIHFFNPETDYALACGSDSYTPPASVVAIRKTLSLLPALFADDGDFILTVDDNCNLKDSPYFPLVGLKHLELITPADLRSVSAAAFRPWGWNLPLRNFLKRHSFDNFSIPSPDDLARHRSLSHRSLTIEFNRFFNSNSCLNIKLPEEFSDPDDAMRFLDKNPGCFFKAPWSSSGRGILSTGSFSLNKIESWVGGIIRSQGSVMAEPGYIRTLDFASEWICRDGKAIFSGLSVFSTSERGGYKYNYLSPQEKLQEIITENIDTDLDLVLSLQKKALESLVSPFYQGPVGIDMLSTSDRRIIPCVEVNLRQTMGMTAVSVSTRMEKSGPVAEYLRVLYPDSLFHPLK